MGEKRKEDGVDRYINRRSAAPRDLEVWTSAYKLGLVDSGRPLVR